MNLLSVVRVSFAVFGAHSSATQQKQSPEIVEIDGRKNPEQIPEYLGWRQALRVLQSGGREKLPTPIYKTATESEARLMIDEGVRLNKIEVECNSRLLKAREPLRELEQAGASKEKRATLIRTHRIDSVMWDIELECRWETIKSRDRLMRELSAETGAELRNFVEVIKSGMSVSVPKNGLPRFRQPQ